MTRDERGSISLWMITCSFAMIMLVGLTVDLGGQVHAQQRARNIAAQAARVGGQEVQAPPAVQGQYLALSVNAARAASQQYLAAAGVDGTVTISGGNTLTVHVTDSYQPRFLTLIGVTHLDVTGTASARLVRTLGGTEE